MKQDYEGLDYMICSINFGSTSVGQFDIVFLTEKGSRKKQLFYGQADHGGYGREKLNQKAYIKGRCKKKENKLTSVCFAFTHTYTLEKLTKFPFFPQAYMEIFERCAKT